MLMSGSERIHEDSGLGFRRMSSLAVVTRGRSAPNVEHWIEAPEPDASGHFSGLIQFFPALCKAANSVGVENAFHPDNGCSPHTNAWTGKQVPGTNALAQVR